MRELAFLNGHGKLETVEISDNFITKIPELYGLVSIHEINLKYFC